ncbi:MAG: lipid II flippase MurJ [Pseudomonadota bacterium]
MFLKAGAVSLALLLASRLLGLLRESALAAAFGASGLGDVAVLMLALPDWIVSVLVTGALGYVLLPAWAQADAAAIGAAQRRLTRLLLIGGVVLAAVMAVARVPIAQWLAPGVGADLRGAAAQAMLWSALALPLALWAALGATRLQHEHEFVGMYGANLVVNGVLIGTLLLVAQGGAQAVHLLGLGLLLAMALRLGWLGWRQRPFRTAAPVAAQPVSLPPLPVWLWAALGAGLPLALPFAARTLASRGGEGALATFNYAWKLVELPQLLAIQLVATLALPTIARALAAPDAAASDTAARSVRAAFALAWALACAAAAGLLLAAPALAQLLFGWGRMDAAALERIAAWGRAGAWSLPPQALIAVALAAAAARRRMRPAVFAYAAALAVLAILGARGMHDGASLMLLLDAVIAGVAAWTLLSLGRDLRSWLPARALFTAVLVLAAWAAADMLTGFSARLSLPGQLATAVLAAASVLIATAWASTDLRNALRR